MTVSTSTLAQTARADLEAAIDRHGGLAAFSFSGGKDSTACAYLLRELADRLVVYCVDTGDLLPETHETIRAVKPMFPHFEMIRTDAARFIRDVGLPSDLVPYQSHTIGRAIGQATIPLVSRYDCCFANVMWPILQRVKQNGHTLLIRGTKAADMPRLPVSNGDVAAGIEMAYPLQTWDDHQVMRYLWEQNAPVSPVYEFARGQLDCGTCPAWWSEKRGAYLKAKHPDLFPLYEARFRKVVDALRPAIGEFLDVLGADDASESTANSAIDRTK